MTPSPTSPHRAAVAAAAALCATALMAGCSGSGSPDSADRSPSSAPATSPARAAAPSVSTDLQNAYQRVVKDVLPSVVQITTGEGLGSGVVYDARGHIVTNAHVVGQEKTFKVTTARGSRSLNASLVASYPEQDLAVIKIDKAPGDLKPAAFGDSAKVEIGQIVLAMGSPLGLSGSVTQGIVSATGRTVSEPSSGGDTGATLANVVQTSAAINPGNSGGALVNLSDQVIGIPTLAATDPQMGEGAAPGIGFAIPASTVRNIADQIIKDGKVTNSGRAALGITGRTIVGQDFEGAGVSVASVKEGGPADQAGIKAGDVIVKFDGTAVRTMQDLSEALAGHKPGDKVEVTVDRDGAQKTVRVTLGTI
ncbi:signal protein PDZ [Streptomyces rimosus subsp. pseudoverticillatus]|uniref:S1C family serine protease n=1 Tax=Streptomyces rimosus TaxID=1927 RepID=UPI0006B2652C|nr:trypsin-like peptidase domain-containing protein [Streptomyces rimosus]KOT78816.1 signal protein PDZ [Streptomyces rimosus subsp. pseudoverticillatus]